MMARTGRSGVMLCALLTWMLSHVMMELEGILHDNCPDCGSTVATVPFQEYCQAQLTCRCGFGMGHRKCNLLNKEVHQTCKATSCGWKNIHYDLGEHHQHHLEHCITRNHPSSSRPNPDKAPRIQPNPDTAGPSGEK